MKRNLLVVPFLIIAALGVILSIGSLAQAEKLGAAFENLIGKWFRLDGGYVIEIKNVEPSGKMEAAYFNPRPVNVSMAEAKNVDGVPEVFIELRDDGYPDSTYTLMYGDKRDELVGVYFHAGIKRKFNVMFVRVR
jgi:hypothetical protein